MWKDLTMGQKSEVMRLAVQQGFSDLNNIREMYDTATSVYNTSSNNTYDNVPYNPSPKDVRYDNGGKVWKALDNIEYRAIPDPSFNRYLTGAGDIEYFSSDEPGIVYNNNYYKAHPAPGEDIILYNPNTNDEQDIRLDALHIMPKDSIYDTLNTLYRERAKDSEVYDQAWKRYNEDLNWRLKNHKTILPMDPSEQYFNNEADGLLRNMLIEGSPEYIASKRYYPDKQQLKKWNRYLMPYINDIQYYLETGKRPAGLLPEVEVNPKAYGGPLGNIYQGKGNKSQKLKKPSEPLRFSNVADMIKHFEGFRSTPYKDGRDKKTGAQWYSIGYGFNDSGLHRNIALQHLNSGKAMSRAEADKLIVGYIDNLDKQLKNALGSKLYNSLTPGQKMAYIDTGYQNPSVMYKAARIHKNTGDLEKTARALSVANFTDRNSSRYHTFMYGPKSSGWDGTKSVQENLDNIIVKSPYDINKTVSFPHNNWTSNANIVNVKGDNNITGALAFPQLAIDQNSPIYYHPVQDMAWTPPVYSTPPTESIAPAIMETPTRPMIVDAFAEDTAPTVNFDKMWASIFPQVEESTPTVVTPYEQFMTLQSRPRHTVEPIPVVAPPTPIVDNNYLLFEPMSTLGYGGKVNKFYNGSIMIKQLPEEFVQEYPEMKVTTPSGNSVTLQEAYNKWGDTPISRGAVPHLSDFLTRQNQPDIATAREVELAQQHRANEEFNRQADNFFGANWLRPSQWVGAFDPHGQASNIPFAQRLLLGTGNTGLVSQEFIQEHPYIGEGLNVAFDFALPGAVKGVPEMYNAARYNPYTLNRAMNSTPKYVTTEGLKSTPNYSYMKENIDSPLNVGYKYEGMDFSSPSSIVDEYMYGQLISGEDVLGHSQKLQLGLDPEVTEYLMKNKVGRDMKALEEAEVDLEFIKQKENWLRQTMEKNVQVGEYSGKDYARAGKEHYGGMFFEDKNFISVNKDSNFPRNFVQKHEGTHLLDKYHVLTEGQQGILDAAYDTGFEKLPEWEGSDDWLKGYDRIAKEKVTTNRDARDTLLGDYQKFDVHAQNLLIDKMPDEKIVEAIREANGYGRNYINFLEGTGGLTPEKIQQFREAMKKVGVVTGIIAGATGASTSNIIEK